MKHTKSTTEDSQILIKGEFVGDYNGMVEHLEKRTMKVPNTNWKIRKGSDWFIETAHQYFAGKRVLVVSLLVLLHLLEAVCNFQVWKRYTMISRQKV